VTGAESGRARRPHLTTSNKLMGTGAFSEAVPTDDDYRRGYLCGMIRGDAHLGTVDYLRRMEAHANHTGFASRCAIRRPS